MSKYDPLEDYLKQTPDDEVPMGFSEIEHVLGFDLPKSSRTQRAWWSNNPTNNVMTQAWVDAGYETASVDMTAETLIFKRARKPAMNRTAKIAPSDPNYVKVHPAWGAMKGLLTIPDGLDLTQPADPEWTNLLDETYGLKRE